MSTPEATLNDPRIRLARVAQVAQQQAAMNSLANLGIKIDTWDESVLEQTMPNPPYVWGNIDLNSALQNASILGADSFRVTHLESAISDHPRGTYFAGMDDPAKSIEIDLHDANSEKTEKAVVLLLPDAPPVAIHADDLAFVEKEKSIRMALSACYAHPAKSINKVQAAFGEEAVEVLSPAACAAIITALETSVLEASPFGD